MNNSIVIALTKNAELISKKEKYFKNHPNLLFIYTGKSLSNEQEYLEKEYYRNYESICETLITRADINKKSFDISKIISEYFVKNLFPDNYYNVNNLIIDGVIYRNIGIKIGKALLFFEKYMKNINPELIIVDRRCETANLIGLIAQYLKYDVKYLNKHKITEWYGLFIYYLFNRTIFEILIKPIISIILRYLYRIYPDVEKNINNKKIAFLSFDINHFKTIFPLLKKINKDNIYNPVLLLPIMGKRLVPFGMQESKKEKINVALTDNFINIKILLKQIYFRIVSFYKISKLRRHGSNNLSTNIIFKEISYLRFVLTNIWIAYYYINLINRIQSKHDFKYYILGDDGSTYARSIILGLSKTALQPKSIVMQHGIMADKYMYIPHADYALLWGLQSKMLLKEFVDDTNKLIVFGAPRLEQTINEYKLRKSVNNISKNIAIENVLIALSPLYGDNDKDIKNIRSIINVILVRFGGVKVFIRFHPSQKSKLFFNILNMKQGSILSDDNPDVSKSINKVDLVITFASSVGIESMLLGKLTVFLYPYTGDWVMNVKEKLPLVAENIDEFNVIINKLCNTQYLSDFINKQDKIIEDLICISQDAEIDDLLAKITDLK